MSASIIHGAGTAAFLPGGIYPHDPDRPVWEVGPPTTGCTREHTARDEKQHTSSAPARAVAPATFAALDRQWPDLLERHGLSPALVTGEPPSRQAHVWWSLEDLALVAVLYAHFARPGRGVYSHMLEVLRCIPGQRDFKWDRERLRRAVDHARTCLPVFLTRAEHKPGDQRVGNPRMAGGHATAAALAALAPEHRDLLKRRGIRC